MVSLVVYNTAVYASELDFYQKAVGQILFLLHRLDMVDIDNDPPRLWPEALSKLLDITKPMDAAMASLTIKCYQNWNTMFVLEWLKTLDLQDEERKATHAFNANRIRGKDLKDLDKNDLREMGLSYPTSKRIRDAIQLL